ncbi:MAG: PxKF domain-containing protein [Methylococcales bacterium]|nr:PxKF domain-containing protein [Methylococcales bacterium]
MKSQQKLKTTNLEGIMPAFGSLSFSRKKFFSIHRILSFLIIIAFILGTNYFSANASVEQDPADQLEFQSSNITQLSSTAGARPVSDNQGESPSVLENPPLMFIENVGQFAPRARFVVSAGSTTVYFSDKDIWFVVLEADKQDHKADPYENYENGISSESSIKGVNVKLNFIGQDSDAVIEPVGRIDTNFSYFLGSDDNNQHTGVPAWGGIKYKNIYPGMDLEISAQAQGLSWNFVITDSLLFYESNTQIIQQGIRIKLAGHQKLESKNEKFSATTPYGNISLENLYLNGKEISPAVDENGDLSIPVTTQTGGVGVLASLMRLQTEPGVLIQPQQQTTSNLILAMLFGGGAYTYDAGWGTAVGLDGSVFVTGETRSLDFYPEMTGDVVYNGNRDGFAIKIDPDGNVEYVTYIGGSGSEGGFAIQVNDIGEAYIAGITSSTNFPHSTDAISASPTSSYLLKLSAGGDQILYSSYIGNSATFLVSMDIDSDENIYMLSRGSTQGTVYKLHPGNSSYDYIHSLGSGRWVGIAVDSSGYAYFTGRTLTSPYDVLAASISDTGAPVYSRSFGGSSYDSGFGVAVDSGGFVYITGGTDSLNFPEIGTPITSDGVVQDVFVTILNPAGAIQYSSYMELNGSEYGQAIAVDNQNSVYVIGVNTESVDFPSTSGAVWGWEGAGGSSNDVFVVKLTPTVLRESYQISYATQVGGTDWDFTYSTIGTVDNSGNVYITGETQSPDFVGTGGAVPGDYQVFVVKIATGGNIPYDCYGDVASLSPIARAVYDEVESGQEFCGNNFDSLITLPPGEDAFLRFSTLAESAKYEIDFTTMLWDEYIPELGDSAGRIFLTGVKELHSKVVNSNTADDYSEGVQVRILIGLDINSLDFASFTGAPLPWDDIYQYQHARIMEDLNELEIPLVDTNWQIEVALYTASTSNTYSHVKLMIVDGKTIITGGYNMQYTYLNGGSRRDMGVEISGPIALSTLTVFDNLWSNAILCQSVVDGECIESSVTLQRHPMLNNPISTGNDIVFSLYRDDNNKSADSAIVAAINAANSHVNIMQNRFVNTFILPMPYARAVLDVLKKDGVEQVNVNLLVSGEVGDLSLNKIGICSLKKRLANENPSKLQYFEARSLKPSVHTKALSIDNSFIIVGSQNFDVSAWLDFNGNLDLAEYSLGIDSSQGTNTSANDFDDYFEDEWANANTVSCKTDNSSLQGEVDQAEAGSVIFIPAGVYTESVTINKPLTLVGANNQTIIQPVGDEPAFRITSSDVVIANMKIKGGDGYGIELIDSSPSSLENIQIYRVVFEENEQGGVLVQGLIPGSPVNYTIENSTFIGGGSGITINMLETQAEKSLIRNNIFYSQLRFPIEILSENDSHVEYSFNLFDNCDSGTCTIYWRDTQGGVLNPLSSQHDNLFDLDPRFMSAGDGAYQLSATSPAIDAGDPRLTHELDYDGNNDEIVQIDIGAFEYAPFTNLPPVVTAGEDQSIELGNPVTISTTYTDEDNIEDHTAQISWGDGVVEDISVTATALNQGEVIGTHTYIDIGSYAVEICVISLYGGVGCDTLQVNVTQPPTQFTFTGFFPPVDNQPTINTVNAGRAIPVKFSLNGYQGLDIFAAGYPTSVAVTCGTSAEDTIEQTVTAGGSSLSYDAATDQYTYVWMTNKAWANTCRTLVLKLSDGSYYRANFKFKK